jgi:uncharacterized protein (DUF305 family)
MTEHHQGALDMAQQSAAQAKHAEQKELSANIITAQQTRNRPNEAMATAMGYTTNPKPDHSSTSH